MDARKLIQEIKSMLVGDEYDYAAGTLRGILTTLEQTHIVTRAQWQAIENIAAKKDRETARTSRAGGRQRSRRYS